MQTIFSGKLAFCVVLLFVIVFGNIASVTYAQKSVPDFTAKCGKVEPTSGERPLLVVLLKPDDPLWNTNVNMFALKPDGYIHQKIFNVLKPVSGNIHLRAYNGQYMVAENGGGQTVNANGTQTSNGGTFTLIDINGDTLESGDQVQLKTSDGKHYLVAERGGGQELRADRTRASIWETFVIMKNGNGSIQHGDNIALQTHNGHYVAAEGGGGGEVNATSRTKGSWETFKIKSSRSSWHKEIALPQTRKFKSAPAVVNFRTLQSVFALGVDGYIYQTLNSAYEADSDWRNWSKLPGTMKFKSGPTALNTLAGKLLSVFATGVDGYVYQTIYSRDPGSGWNKEWSKLPGSQKFEFAPTAFNTPDGNILSVMATGVDGYIYQTIYARGPGSHWSKWEKLPGSQQFESAPMAFNTPDGKMLSVMATGVDGHIYQIIYARGADSHWRKWIRLPGEQKFISGPWSMNSADGNLAMVYALGEDNIVYENIYIRETGSRWLDWETIPGNDSHKSGPAVIYSIARMKRPEHFRKVLFDSADSVREYFLENSYGKFTIREAYITPWVTTKDNPVTYSLDESSFDFIHNFDGEEGSLQRKSVWVVDHVERTTPFQFKDFDADRNGKITDSELLILWIYPGAGDARVRGFTPPLVTVPSLSKGVEVSGLMRGGASMSMMSLAHELGHQALYLGDLYPQAGHFSLMSMQNRGSHLDPWSKIKLGWIKPKVITTDGWYTLNPVETHPEACILYNPKKGRKEYFIIENRWPGNSYEKNLPDEGLAIWHIDESSCNGGYDSRKTINLVSPMAGSLQLWDGADPKTGYDFTPSSSPANSNWFDGTPSGISVKNIPTASSQAKFYIDVP